MKKLLGATAVCALAIGLVVAPGAGAVKSTKEVFGTVSVSVTPSTVSAAAPTNLTVSGNVKSNSGCRKNRVVRFAYVVGATGPDISAVTVTTGPNGDYTASLPQPTTGATPASVTLQVTVDDAIRKVGSKKKPKTKKGRQFHCNDLTASFSPITVNQ
jgi:hypothetical protein